MSASITAREISQALRLLLEENEMLRRQIAAGSTSSSSNRPKLSSGDVKRIREMKRDGLKVTEIASVFDCHHATVSRTLRGIYHR